MKSFPVTAAEQLHFKVVVVPQTLFNQNTGITKLPLGIVLHLAVYPAKPFNFAYLFNTHTAAAGCGFHKYGRIFYVMAFLIIQQIVGNFFIFHFIINRAVSARDDRNGEGFRHLLRVDLIAQIFDDLPVGADKGQWPVPYGHPSSKTKIFRKKAISRMNRCTVCMVCYS